MKKKFIIASLFILINTLHTYSQVTHPNNVQIGINLPDPQADFYVVGGMRFEHYTQGAGKILVSNAKGEVRWTAPFSLKFLSGSLPTRGVNLSGENAMYTFARITLPPGGYLFKAIFLLNNRNGLLKVNQGTFVTVYLSDSATDPTYTLDYMPGSAKEMSGSLVGPAEYGLIDGSVAIRNNSAASKTYYLWAKKEDFTDNSTSPTKTVVQLNDLGSTNWGENIIYAIPIE